MSSPTSADVREGWGYLLLLWSGAVALLASGTALLILMLSVVIGPFRFLDLAEERKVRTLGIWAVAGPTPESRVETHRRWQAFRAVAPPELPLQVFESLEEVRQARVQLLAVPDGRRLSPEQASALLHYVRRGGAVVLMGSVGVRGPGDSWSGYELLKELLDVPAVQPLEGRASGFVRAARRGPLSASIFPGDGFSLRPETGVPAIENADAELRWSLAACSSRPMALRDDGECGADDWQQEPGRAASKRRSIGRGRLVWLGLGPENMVEGADRDRRAVTAVVRAALAWASRDLLLEVLPWPKGAAFAGAVASERSEPSGAGSSLEPERYIHELAPRLDAARASGAYVVLPPPPSGSVAEGRPSPIAIAYAALQRRGAWLTQSAEIQKWRLRRSRLAASLSRVGPNRVLVEITNRDRAPLEDVALRVHFNRPVAGAQIEQTAVLQDVPKLRFRSGDERVDFLLPDLPARASRAYTLDFELSDADS